MWGSGGVASPFFTLALVEVSGQLHAPALYTQGKRTPCTHWIGGWVDPRADLGIVEEKNSMLPPGIEPRSSSL
jgi:hypothetical protein